MTPVHESEYIANCPECGAYKLYEACVPGGPCGYECDACGYQELDSIPIG